MPNGEKCSWVEGELVGMEGSLPKKDGFSTKGKQGNVCLSPNLHACVSVSKLNSMSHVLCMQLSFTCLEMMSSALTLFHLKTCSSSTNLV